MILSHDVILLTNDSIRDICRCAPCVHIYNWGNVDANG